MNQVDNSIDQMGEQIGQGIDDAAKDITSGLKKTGEKTGDFWENWRDYLTPNNAEKIRQRRPPLPPLYDRGFVAADPRVRLGLRPVFPAFI
ncbi:hypothetical protein LOB54_02925 [Lactobacillus delbrueckii subsp. bulgaricus]|uniref:hypothetical protein n=1 Tax=Lactobacillus delbrueckii TaxID=1584 RepID=UPI001E648623|nr:hypothetical protein [Lactobacillus delbrueckii]MCD5461679.1 hypothetical protein [Lactobacillus delbrueckii subsp. bulgaricus]MCD5477250.1 hypothetical protein [Lactobacillus delbrueckii subsp. bulgaricus]UUY35082.1 hypothetical protein NUU01_06000 [Lactobacillus delbrueckii subsp. bulgaricus]